MTHQAPSQPLSYREILDYYRAMQPTTCPNPACQSTNIAPLFLDEADDSWDCSDCGAFWSPGR